MAANTLHIELPDAERPSVWPWIIALLSAAALVVVTAQKLQTIPSNLLSSAQGYIAESGIDTINASINGRDLSLAGTMDTQQSVDRLLTQLGNIDGMRIVRDEITRVDQAQVLRQETENFLQQLTNIDVSNVAFVPGSVSFTAGSDVSLDQLATLLSANPTKRIRIEGHTDNTGPAAVNLRLSSERAQAVAQYLTARNVASDQLIAKGYGATQPIADNASESGRARNRRIEISYVD